MKPRGFTMVEMMITLVIILVLAAVAFPAYSYYVKRARQAEATTALGDIRAAQLLFKQDMRQGNGQFAQSLDELGWKLSETGATMGKGPAYYTYSTNQNFSAAITPHADTVRDPALYLDHGSGSIRTYN